LHCNDPITVRIVLRISSVRNEPMMPYCRSGLLGVCLAAALVSGRAQSSPINRPWPPGVQTVAEASPALPPEEALKTFYMPPGYRIELVASEPLVQDPVSIDW